MSGNAKENLPVPPKEGKRRFRLVRLEERIAPVNGYWTSPNTGCNPIPTAQAPCALPTVQGCFR
jgi:hypothetical protein